MSCSRTLSRDGTVLASPEFVNDVRAAVARFDRPLEVIGDPEVRRRTEQRLAEEQERAETWLAGHSTFLAAGGVLPDPARRTGSPLLFDDLGGGRRQCGRLPD